MSVTHGPIETRWALWTEELDGFETVTSPTAPLSVAVRRNLNVQRFGGPSDAQMSVLPTASGPLAVSLAQVWRSAHTRDNLFDVRQRLELLARHDPKLGRRPIVIFSWGDVYIEGYLSTLDFEWIDGLWPIDPFYHKAMRVSIGIEEVQEVTLEPSGRFVRSTKLVTVGPNDTFETIAWAEYRDPDKGWNIRLANPVQARRGLRAGDVLRVLPADHPDTRRVRSPRAPAFIAGSRATIQERAETRLAWRGPGLAALEEQFGL